MKRNKALKITLIILIIILLSIISFVGIYVQNKNVVKNVLPEYILAKDLAGYRFVELKPAEDNKETENDQETNNENSSEETDKEETTEKSETETVTENVKNYKKAKEILEKRLKTMQVSNYIIRQDKEDGRIILELPENDNTDRVVGEGAMTGKFEIVDKDTDEVLMSNADIKTVKAGYGTSASGTTAVYINIEFNKEGTQKFKDITNTYIQTTVVKEKQETQTQEATENEENQNQETGEPETETITKQIAIKLDDSPILTTYFDKEVTNGILQLTMGSSSTTREEMQEYLLEAISLSAILDSGKLPVNYTVEQNKYISSNITINELKTLIIVAIVVLAVALCYMILKYKAKGILASISQIGYIAVLLIAIRYFNVELSTSGIMAILFSIVISYVMTISILGRKGTLLNTFKHIAIALIPALILSITFVFSNILIGTVLFWGIVIAFLYNASITNLLLKD